MNIKSLITILIASTMTLAGCGDEHVEEELNTNAPASDWSQVSSPKADRATMDPDEVLSEGSGEHGVEEATQQDEVLHRSLSAAAWAARIRFPRGAEHFMHFLQNTGEALDMEVDRLLADNPIENIEDASTSLGSRVSEELEVLKAEANAWIQENGNGQEALEGSLSGEWSHFYATQGDWYWALGGFQFRIDAEVSYVPGAPVTIRYKVQVEDHYNWDAGKEIELPFNLKITDEIFQRLHIVGIAREFVIEGVSSLQVYEYDYEHQQ